MPLSVFLTIKTALSTLGKQLQGRNVYFVPDFRRLSPRLLGPIALGLADTGHHGDGGRDVPFKMARNRESMGKWAGTSPFPEFNLVTTVFNRLHLLTFLSLSHNAINLFIYL